MVSVSYKKKRKKKKNLAYSYSELLLVSLRLWKFGTALVLNFSVYTGQWI